MFKHPASTEAPLYDPRVAPFPVGVAEGEYYFWDPLKHHAFFLFGPSEAGVKFTSELILSETMRRGVEVTLRTPAGSTVNVRDGVKTATKENMGAFLNRVKEDLTVRAMKIADQRLELWDPHLIVIEDCPSAFFFEESILHEVVQLAKDTEVFFLISGHKARVEKIVDSSEENDNLIGMSAEAFGPVKLDVLTNRSDKRENTSCFMLAGRKKAVRVDLFNGLASEG